MIEKLKLLFDEARTKVTTYVAIAIAGIAQVADHAEELQAQWPSIAAYLPKGRAIDMAAHWTITGLGFLVVYTRVRRLVRPTAQK